MLRNFSLIFGLAQSQWTESMEFQQLSGQLEQVLNNPAVTELLQDEDFQKFTISDGLTLIRYLQDTNTCSAVLTSIFDTVDTVIEDEYEEYSEEASIFYKIGDALENNINSNLGSSSISNLGSMMKSVFDNTFVSTIISMYTSDYLELPGTWSSRLEETSILDQIDYIRSYGITNFCEQIKIDEEKSNEGGVLTISELIEDNTEDEKYISIGANLDAVVVFIRKIINENNFEFVDMMMNPEIDNSALLLQISLFIEDDVDAMNAWKVISGSTKVFLSVIRDVILEEMDLEFSEDLELWNDYYQKRRDTFSDETEYEISNLASTTYAIQMQFLNAIEVAFVTLAERLERLSSCEDYETYTEKLYMECLTEFIDELMETIDEMNTKEGLTTMDEIGTKEGLTTIAAITVILIILILTVVSCVRCCCRKKIYNKYDKLETESSYPSVRVFVSLPKGSSFDERIEHV